MNSSPIYLLKDGGSAVDAVLWDGIGANQMSDWVDHWEPAKASGLRRLAEAKAPRGALPQSRHWVWPEKVREASGVLARKGFCIVAEGVTQGLMLVTTASFSRVDGQKGKPIVYVDYLETAPWNRHNFVYERPKYAGVGSLLLGVAMELSRLEDYKGRIGLHSLPQADDWYRRRGMIDLGVDEDYQNLHYFEMTADGAAKYLNKG